MVMSQSVRSRPVPLVIPSFISVSSKIRYSRALLFSPCVYLVSVHLATWTCSLLLCLFNDAEQTVLTHYITNRFCELGTNVSVRSGR